MTPKQVKQIANSHRWRFVGQVPNQTVLEFKRMSDVVLVDYEVMQVMTMVFHPKLKQKFRGPSKLVRYGVDEELLNAIFENPRVHTQNAADLPTRADR